MKQILLILLVLCACNLLYNHFILKELKKQVQTQREAIEVFQGLFILQEAGADKILENLESKLTSGDNG